MHHIITDGWSMEILQEEFNHLYTGYANGKDPALASLLLQYKDFAAWHNAGIRDRGYKERGQRFWKKKLESGLPMLKLSHHYHSNYRDSDDRAGTVKGGGYRCVVDQILKERLHRLAGENQTSLFMILFSMYNLLMAFVSGQDQVVSAVISSGRQHVSLQPIVGYFVNPVIIKTRVNLREVFEKLVSRINRDVLEALQYQNYPLELVLDNMNREFPEVAIAFNMLNLEDISLQREMEPLSAPHSETHQDVKFDIVLFAKEYKNGIGLKFEYRRTLFNPKTIETFARKYLELMEDLTFNDEEQC
jgi:hypothetical protein